jgi:hypothetical protein
MARKRGTYLTPELLEKLNDEMWRDRRSGSWILRDALETRYGIQPATAKSANRTTGVDYLPKTGEVVTVPESRKITTEITAGAPDGVPMRSVSGAGRPATATEPPVVATEPSVIVTGTTNAVHDRPPAVADVDNAVPRRPTSHVSVRSVPVHDGKLRRDLGEAQTELGLTRTALDIANLDRERALKELEEARAETQHVRAESSSREAKLVATLNRRPLLARDSSRRAYVRVAARDSSGKQVVKTYPLVGHRLRLRRK